MSNIVNIFANKFAKDMPEQYRANFFHLVADIFWYGILNGTSLSFNTVYMTRIGGSEFHIGLLAAAPAIVNILFALPFGSWLTRKNIAREVAISSIWHRLFYLLWVPLPILFHESIQIWMLIALTFIMFIPGTILQVGFNDMFAEAVPGEWRGVVAGLRNAGLAFTTVVISLVCGDVLTKVAFPTNYQLVFMFGFLGAGLSSWHIWQVWKNLDKTRSPFIPPVMEKKPVWLRIKSSWIPDFKFITKEGGKKFYLVVAGLLFFHFAQYLPIPLFPVYMVNELHLSDRWISIGNGIFSAMVFLISTQLARISAKIGNKKVIGIGVVLLGFYPAIFSFSTTIYHYFFASIIGGFAWGLAGGVIYNYLLENVPEKNRATFLAIYNLALYIAILCGSLLGPLISNWIGISQALLLFGIMRMLAGLVILRWG